MIQEANNDIKALSDSVSDLEEKLKKVAEFFCEDKKKFKIEELFGRLLKFVEQLPVLAKVRIVILLALQACGMKWWGI